MLPSHVEEAGEARERQAGEDSVSSSRDQGAVRKSGGDRANPGARQRNGVHRPSTGEWTTCGDPGSRECTLLPGPIR